MKVKDLIEELSLYNPNADVTLEVSEDITISYICKTPTGEPLTKETTNQLSIEPIDNCSDCSHMYEFDGQRECSFYDKPCKEVDECNQ